MQIFLVIQSHRLYNESKRSSYEAGVTVVCNDRVVLYNDKSGLTGWGTSGVPNYHTQFIGIKLLKDFNFVFDDKAEEASSYISFYKYYPSFQSINF